MYIYMKKPPACGLMNKITIAGVRQTARAKGDHRYGK